jgi:rubrerythrin
MDLKGSRTEKHLLMAFAGESQARNRYTYFASVAKKEGYEKIAGAFLDSAENEREHAKREFKFLPGGETEITAAFPSGKIGTTAENLKAAAAGEHYEWTEMYPDFAKVAHEEGFHDIAAAFEHIARAEKGHEARYLELLTALQSGKLFKADQPVKWRCRNCGYIHEGTEPPAVCPACTHPKAHFEIIRENW